MNILPTYVLVICSVMYGNSHAAGQHDKWPYASWYQDRVVLTPSLGLLSNSTREYVYSDNYKLSQLDWDVSNVPVLKLDIDYYMTPKIIFYTKLWITLHARNGAMDDYDWMNPSQTAWTHWSHHHKTPLNIAYEADMGIVLRFIDRENWNADMLFGYQMSEYNWTAYGGKYNYDNGRDISTQSDSIPVINYDQQLTTTYIGAAGKYTYRQWTFGALAKFSLNAKINDFDNHLLRDIYYKGTMKGGLFFSSGLSVDYAVTPQLQITTNFTYTSFSKSRGDTEILDNNAGGTTFTSDSAVASNTSRLLTLGVRYAF